MLTSNLCNNFIVPIYLQIHVITMLLRQYIFAILIACFLVRVNFLEKMCIQQDLVYMYVHSVNSKK